jgi:non-specific serine/threonine protein kinase
MHRAPADFTIFVCPILLVRAASAVGARDALADIAAGNLWCDSEPWHKAHHLLAQGSAAAIVGASDAQSLLRGAQERFERLGAPFFAELATQALGAPAPVSSDTQKTTRREREVAALVADGMTNREIAEKLVLSERTVEGHIANLFAKVNANSRTQLATWYLRVASSAS